MVIGWLRRENGAAGPEPGRSSPWRMVEEAQKNPRLPCLLTPQPAHAVMAGDLAQALLPSVFGEIPQEIQQAIMMHDTGWAMIDAAQLQRLRSDSPEARRTIPVSFTSNSPQEMVEGLDCFDRQRRASDQGWRYGSEPALYSYSQTGSVRA